MVCKKPFARGTLTFGCGQCVPCRISKKRLWAFRIYLESMLHKSSSFATLTYSPENLPPGGTLVPKHFQDFMKRLRARIEVDQRKVRFFGVGEYGEQSERPHYHAILYGISPFEADLVGSCWSHGFVQLGDVNLHSAQYVAGYTVKKLTNGKDPYVQEKLNGRHPEFARMSLKPGIAADAVEKIKNSLTPEQFENYFQETGDVPKQLQVGKTKYPLGRYLTKKLRLAAGKGEKNSEAIIRWSADMSVLLDEAFKKPENQKKGIKGIIKSQNEGKIASIEAKEKIFKQKRII